MNSLTGQFLFAEPPALRTRTVHDTAMQFEPAVRAFAFDDRRLEFELALSTVTAMWFRHDSRSLLAWGVRSKSVLGTDVSEWTRFADRLAREPEAALQSLRGPWVLLYVDGQSGELIFATDRAATRSPCFARLPDRLVFGLTARDVSRRDPRLQELRAQAVFDYLYFHVIPSPLTVFANVERLSPGEFVHVTGTDVQRRRYWEPHYPESMDSGQTRDKSPQQLLGLLQASVAAELESGKVGAFLSGGTDSSTIAGMLGRVTGEPAHTYSIGFDAAGFDEMEYARTAARHFGTRHHEFYVTPDDLVRSMPEVAAAYDQPFGNSSALPAFYCARLAQADGVTKILGGDGGDELFGGNTRYAKQKVFEAYGRLPHWLRDGLAEPLLLRAGITRHIPVVRKGRSYIEQAKVPMPGRLQTYNLLARIGIERIFLPEFLAAVDPNAPLAQQTAYYNRCEARSLVNRMLHFDWKFTLADNDLPKVVGMCDLAGVQVGFPMLNEELVEFANCLPASSKVKGLRLRHFFKETLRGFLPREIIEKKKHGFGLPFGLWLVKHRGLQDLAFGSLQELRKRNVVRPDFFDELLEPRLAQHPSYYGELVWTLTMLELWFLAHAPDQRFG